MPDTSRFQKWRLVCLSCYHARTDPFGLAGLLLILLAVVCCAWPGMHAPLFTDDIHQLRESQNYLNWTGIFDTNGFGFYRPVKNALFMLAAPLQNNLWAWHWVGLGAYLAATAGVYRIACICLGARGPALLAAGMWALSPTCVSTAIWLSCANISIGLVFAAALFHFHERWANHPTLPAIAACLFCFAMALHCYESMIAIPALLFLRDLQQRRLALTPQTFIRYGLYTLIALAFLIIRYELSAKNVGTHDFHQGFAPDTQAIHLSLSAPWFLWRHFLMWISPFGHLELLGSYGWMRSASAAALAFGWIFLIAVLTVSGLTWKRYPGLAYGLAFFVVASVPAGNFLPCFNGPIADAYVTIPSIGLAIACATACGCLLQQFRRRQREAKPGGLAIITLACLILLYRLPVCGAYFRYWAGVWNNPLELMLYASETRPFQFQPKGYVSVLLLSQGYIDQAETIAKEVIQEAPWSTLAMTTLARTANYHEDYATAEATYRRILDTPTLDALLKGPVVIELAATIAKTPPRREEAAQLLREFIRSGNPHPNPNAIAQLAQIYYDQGSPAKARATLARGLALFPNHAVLEATLKSIELKASRSLDGLH